MANAAAGVGIVAKTMSSARAAARGRHVRTVGRVSHISFNISSQRSRDETREAPGQRMSVPCAPPRPTTADRGTARIRANTSFEGIQQSDLHSLLYRVSTRHVASAKRRALPPTATRHFGSVRMHASLAPGPRPHLRFPQPTDAPCRMCRVHVPSMCRPSASAAAQSSSIELNRAHRGPSPRLRAAASGWRHPPRPSHRLHGRQRNSPAPARRA